MELDAALPRGVVDAEVRLASLPPALAGGRPLTDWLSATTDEVLVEQAGIRVLVRGTAEVLVELGDDADPALLAPLLYGFVTRALLLHAGTFTLHASVVRHGATVVALAGHSGAGKSTTATALCRLHGAELLVDDVVPARVADGTAQARRFDRPVHLTADAVERFGVDVSTSDVVTPGPRGKFALTAAALGGGISGDGPEWIDLDRLVVLSLAGDEPGLPSGPHITEHPLVGAERLRWIVRLSNVTGLATLGDRAARYFAWATGLADALPMVQLVRPDEGDTLGEVCTAVLRHR
jgi:hypothetical protein